MDIELKTSNEEGIFDRGFSYYPRKAFMQKSTKRNFFDHIDRYNTESFTLNYIKDLV